MLHELINVEIFFTPFLLIKREELFYTVDKAMWFLCRSLSWRNRETCWYIIYITNHIFKVLQRWSVKSHSLPLRKYSLQSTPKLPLKPFSTLLWTQEKQFVCRYLSIHMAFYIFFACTYYCSNCCFWELRGSKQNIRVVMVIRINSIVTIPFASFNRSGKSLTPQLKETRRDV